MQTHLVVEFIIWLLIAASVIAVVAARLRVPYTVALVIGGLVLGTVRTPFLQDVTGLRPDWLTPDIALVIFLPPLLFEGSVKIQFRHLRGDSIPDLRRRRLHHHRAGADHQASAPRARRVNQQRRSL